MSFPNQRGGGSSYYAYERPPTFDAYDVDADGMRPPQQPLRRRGAPVPAPTSLLSIRSTPHENPYESSTVSSAAVSTPSTADTSPPSQRQAKPRSSSRHRQRQPPTTPTTTTTTTSSSSPGTDTASTSPASTANTSSRHPRHHGSRHRDTPDVVHTRPGTAVSTPVSAAAPAMGIFGAGSSSVAAPRSMSRRARERVSRSPTPENAQRSSRPPPPPRVPSSRGAGSTPPRQQPRKRAIEDGPLIVRASTPAAASPSSVRSMHDADTSLRRSTLRPPSSGVHQNGSARSSATSDGSAPPRLETQVPSPSPAAITPATSTSQSPQERVVTAGPVMLSSAERKEAERVARKQLRHSLHQGHIKVHGYVAQTAYAQKNPFRRQDFASFAANPKYQPPAGFDVYPQAMATRVYGLEVSRASQGEFMMQRLVDAAHPATAEERAEMEALLSSTLDKLQVGDWFYKWTRINHVHQRYIWLNLQRGTLMWSLSPKQSVVLNSEIKLSTVTSITPDCLQLEAPMRVFYRMTINTPDRCISLATEIRQKFDVWYRVLLQLTAPNLVYGVPGVWGRPSGSVNMTGRGAASRWASRFSPLDTVMNDTSGHLGHNEVYTQGLLSSSD